MAVDIGTPMPLFEYPFLIAKHCIVLVRTHNVIAFLILLAYFLFGVYYGIYIFKQRNFGNTMLIDFAAATGIFAAPVRNQ